MFDDQEEESTENIPDDENQENESQQDSSSTLPIESRYGYGVDKTSTIDPRWIDAMIKQESNGNPNAISPKNAQGLMQIIPSTFKEFSDPGDNPFDPDTSIKVGSRYFQHLYNQYNDIPLSLAAYNAGPGAIDKYRKRTKNGTFEEVSALMKEDNAFQETRDYVPKITSNYNRIVDGQKKNLKTNEEVSNEFSLTSDGSFKDDLAQIVTSDGFLDKPSTDKIKIIYNSFKGKKRNSQDLQDLKQASSIVWQGAEPGELPSFNQDVGAPPLIPSTDNVDKRLDSWKAEASQRLLDKGIIPEIFGKNFDEYLNSASENEKQAYTARNRSTVGWVLDRAGNYVREGTKGALSLATGTASGVTRLLGGSDETANSIENAPNAWLGTPTRDFLYNTDENGYLKQNPDGTPQTTYQAEISQGVGGIVGIIGSLGVGEALGVSKGILTAADMSVNTLTMAGNSFKNVYEKTKDPEKAYAAAFLSLPASSLASITQLGVLSGKFRPVLTGLSPFNQAKFLSKSVLSNMAVGSATGAVTDLGLQGSEIPFTGEGVNTSRLGVATVAGGIGFGLAGGVSDTIGAKNEYIKQESINRDSVKSATTQLQDFQNGIQTRSTINSKPEHIPKDVAETLGIDIVGATKDGNQTIIQRKSSGVVPPIDSIENLSSAIEGYYTPSEIESINKEHTMLQSVEDTRKLTPDESSRMNELDGIINNPNNNWNSDTYISDIKAHEEALNNYLETNPGSLPVKWNESEKSWENVETGERSTFVKDVLFNKNIEAQNREPSIDVSDISDVKVIKEQDYEAELANLNKTHTDLQNEHTDTLKNIQETKQQIQDKQTQLKDLNSQNKEAAKNQEEITSIHDELNTLGDIQKPTEPAKKSQEQLAKLQTDLESTKAESLRLKNKIENLKTEKAKTANKEKLKALQQTERELRAKTLELKKGSRLETQAQKNYEKSLSAYNRRQELQERLKELNPKVADITRTQKEIKDLQKSLEDARNKISKNKESKSKLAKEINAKEKLRNRFQKGFGSFNKKEGVLTLSKEANDHTYAHEVGHAIQDKIALPEHVKEAIQDKINDLKDRSDLTSAKDLASEVILPDIQPEVPNVTGNKLTPETQKAIFNKDELVSNQLGAIILKQQGKDIGDYQIIPELEDWVTKNVKLPKLFEETPQSVNDIQTKETTTPLNTSTQEDLPLRQDIPNEEKPLIIDARTGEEGETAYSKTMSKEIPERTQNLYEKVSRIKGEKEADEYVSKDGLDEAFRLIDNEDTPIETKILLSGAARRKAAAEAEKNPTSMKAQNDLYKADQIRGYMGTSPAQQMSLLSRFRNADTFPEYVLQLRKALRESGIEPELTEYALKELKALWDKGNNLKGVLKDNYLMRGFKQSLKDKDMTFGQWYKGFIRSNLLSGVIGTGLTNLQGGAFMGPALLAMRHPILGKGIVWRAMINSLGEAGTNFKRIWTTKAGNQLLTALGDSIPLKLDPKNPVQSYLSKFGDGIFKIYASTDEFMRTLSKNGYLVKEKYQDLVKNYGQDPAKFSAEVSKLLISKNDLNSAVNQARNEAANAKVKISDNDAYARAYEILKEGTPDVMLEEATNWANATSLKGSIANPILNKIYQGLFSEKFWEKHPFMAQGVNFIAPFGGAVLRLADYTADFIPGQTLIPGRMGQAEMRPNAALTERFKIAQRISPILATAFGGAVAAGLIEITGEEEKVLDRDGKNKVSGQNAVGRAQYKEYEQTGKTPYSVIIPGVGQWSYRDIPGLNAILFGVHNAQNAIKNGEGIPWAAEEFVRNSLLNAIPFMGINSLSSPYISMFKAFTNPDSTKEGFLNAMETALTQTVKMNTPASSLLRDVKRLYDESPTESNAPLLQRLFRDIPALSELSGNRPALDVFGEPVQKSLLEHIPGLGRIFSDDLGPVDPVTKALINKGIIVPENNKTIKFNKSDFPNEIYHEQYNATREERLSKAYANAFSPEEWYGFIKATGPFIKQVSAQIAASNLPTNVAQQLLIKRVSAIRDNAKKRFIRLGEF